MSLGIDFGSFLNKIACFNQTGFRVISNIYQKSSTPSVAFLNHKDSWIFGEAAIKSGINKPEQFICESKLMLGHKFEDQFIQNRLNSWPFKIQNVDNNIKIIINVDDETQEFFPYEIVGLILKDFINVSSSIFPPIIYQTVISIPASFNYYQKYDLNKATESVNLQNIIYVIEPILASIAYLYSMQADPSENRTILVYSLSYSHLEASIIQIHDMEYDIISINDEKINGRQFDHNIFNYAKEKMLKKYPNKKAYLENYKTQSKLLISCQEAKSILTESDSVNISIKSDKEESDTDYYDDDDNDDDDLNEPTDLFITLTYNDFICINSELFEKSMNPVKTVLDRAEINPKSVDNIFLVGGSTYMKLIRDKLMNITEKVPCPSVDPCEAAALGACIAAAYLARNELSGVAFQNNQEFFSKLSVFEKAFTDDNQLEINEDNAHLIEVKPRNEHKCCNCNCCKCLLV